MNEMSPILESKNPDSELAALKRRLAMLENLVCQQVGEIGKQIADLDHRIQEVIRIGTKYDDALGTHIDVHEDGLREAFSERIKNLETKTFPHLLTDLDALSHKFTGSTRTNTPTGLDKRTPPFKGLAKRPMAEDNPSRSKAHCSWPTKTTTTKSEKRGHRGRPR